MILIESVTSTSDISNIALTNPIAEFSKISSKLHEDTALDCLHLKVLKETRTDKIWTKNNADNKETSSYFLFHRR